MDRYVVTDSGAAETALCTEKSDFKVTDVTFQIPPRKDNRRGGDMENSGQKGSRRPSHSARSIKCIKCSLQRMEREKGGSLGARGTGGLRLKGCKPFQVEKSLESQGEKEMKRKPSAEVRVNAASPVTQSKQLRQKAEQGWVLKEGRS